VKLSFFLPSAVKLLCECLGSHFACSLFRRKFRLYGRLSGAALKSRLHTNAARVFRLKICASAR